MIWISFQPKNTADRSWHIIRCGFYLPGERNGDQHQWIQGVVIKILLQAEFCLQINSQKGVKPPLGVAPLVSRLAGMPPCWDWMPPGFGAAPSCDPRCHRLSYLLLCFLLHFVFGIRNLQPETPTSTWSGVRNSVNNTHSIFMVLRGSCPPALFSPREQGHCLSMVPFPAEGVQKEHAIGFSIS